MYIVIYVLVITYKTADRPAMKPHNHEASYCPTRTLVVSYVHVTLEEGGGGFLDTRTLQIRWSQAISALLLTASSAQPTHLVDKETGHKRLKAVGPGRGVIVPVWVPQDGLVACPIPPSEHGYYIGTMVGPPDRQCHWWVACASASSNAHVK